MSKQRACAQCGLGFKPQRASSVYCSRACASASRRKEDAKWRNPEYVKQYQRQYQAANRERINENALKWSEKNRERRRLISANSASKIRASGKASRRDAVLAAKSAVTSADLLSVFVKARHLCVYCGQYTRVFEVDHYKPISKGGRHSKANIIPCCRSCNASKGARNAEDWIESKFGIYGLARVLTFMSRRSIDLRFYPDSRLKSKLVRAFLGINVEVVK